MLYPLFRPITAMALKVYFRRIYFTGTENIPKDKAVIFAANHPTAFVEPCILACFQFRKLHFLVRGDFFKPPFDLFLRNLHMIPIFRFKDGFQGLRQNADTFRHCHDALNEKKAIMILAEGSTKQSKRLRPLRKGCARISLGTLEKYQDTDIQIVPFGVNYVSPNRFRSDVYCRCGPPISVRAYRERYETDDKTGVNHLTQDIETAMRRDVIHIEDQDHTESVERMFELIRNETDRSFDFGLIKRNDLLDKERDLANGFAVLPEPDRKSTENKLESYFSALTKLGIQDLAVKGHRKSVFLKWAAFLLTIPMFLIGYLVNALPLYVATYLARTRVKILEFKAPIRIAAGLGFYMIYAIVLFLVVVATFGWTAWWLILVLPISGFFAIQCMDLWRDLRASRHKLSTGELAALREQRAEVLQSLSKVLSAGSMAG